MDAKVLFFLFFSVLWPASVVNAEVIMLASWYGSPALEGAPMANGKPFKTNDKTIAAHKSLPLGTKLRVKNPTNGRELTVVVKDRGPFKKGRKLDLSKAAAKKLGYVRKGVTKLAVTVVRSG